MALWSIFRKLTAPATPEQDALYFVADPDNAALTDLIVSGDTGNVRKVKGVTNEAEVTAIASATIAATPFAGIDLGTFN